MANKSRIKHTLEQLLIDKEELAILGGKEVVDNLISYYQAKVKVIDEDFTPSTNKVGPPQTKVSLESIQANETNKEHWTAAIVLDEDKSETLCFSEILQDMCASMRVSKPEDWVKLGLCLVDLGVLYDSKKCFQTVLFKQLQLLVGREFNERSFRDSMRDAGYGRNPKDKLDSFFIEGERKEWIEKIKASYKSSLETLIAGYDEIRAIEEEINREINSFYY